MRSSEPGEPVSLGVPPAPFRITSPNTLEMVEGGGRIAVVFGASSSLVGVFLALGLAGLVHFQTEPEQDPKSFWLPLMTLLFLAVGAATLLGRKWIKLDLASGSVLRQYGLLVPMQSEERWLNEFNAVVIAFDPGDSESPEKYPVRLRASHGKDFIINNPPRFGEAHRQAEYLSRYLRLPLADTTTDHETVLSPEHAGDSLTMRLGSEQPEVPTSLQARRHSEVTQSGGETRIEIRGPRFPLPQVVVTLFPLLILALLIPVIHGAGAAGSGQGLTVLILFFGSPSVILGVNLIAGALRRRTIVNASAAGLAIEQRDAWRTRFNSISAADILDVDHSTSYRSDSASAAFASRLVPGRGLVIKSRNELVTFGEGLPHEELRYLRSVLRKALAGR